MYLVYILTPFAFIFLLVLMLSLSSGVVEWKKMLYFFCFFTGILAYGTGSQIVFLIAIGFVLLLFAVDSLPEMEAPIRNSLFFLAGVLVLTWLANTAGLIEMNVGQAFFSFWPFAFIFMGLNYLRKRKKNAGIVFLEIGIIFQMLNFLFMFERTEYVMAIYGTVYAFFIPLVIMGIVSLLIYNVFIKKGEKEEGNHPLDLEPKEEPQKNDFYSK